VIEKWRWFVRLFIIAGRGPAYSIVYTPALRPLYRSSAPAQEETCLCSPVVKALGCHVPTKELFLIIPMHMMNWELIPGRK